MRRREKDQIREKQKERESINLYFIFIHLKVVRNFEIFKVKMKDKWEMLWFAYILIPNSYDPLESGA